MEWSKKEKKRAPQALFFVQPNAIKVIDRKQRRHSWLVTWLFRPLLQDLSICAGCKKKMLSPRWKEKKSHQSPRREEVNGERKRGKGKDKKRNAKIESSIIDNPVWCNKVEGKSKSKQETEPEKSGNEDGGRSCTNNVRQWSPLLLPVCSLFLACLGCRAIKWMEWICLINCQ